MTTQNEKSPLTRNASGQENGTAIEARGLSSADNGMPAENLSQRKVLAPKQASEAANQRPSKENATAESIVDARAAGGNGTSSKVGRADALTVAAALNAYEKASIAASECDSIEDARIAFVHSILAASPLEQPAAAPNDSGTVSGACFSGSYPHGTITYSQLAPSPADERAAFPRYAEWLHLRTHGEWSSGVPAWARDHTGRMNDFTAASAVIEELAAARASSANGTGAEGVRAWETDDGRVISDEQKQQALRDGGASASSVRPFSIALGRIGAVLSMAAEAVAIGDHDLSTSAGGRDYIAEFFAKRLCRHDFGRYIHERLAADFACALAQYLRDREAAPQPAQADARQTDDEWWNQALRERDIYEEYADEMASAIANHLHIEIGEHSNFNNPWLKALEAIKNARQADARGGLTDEQRVTIERAISEVELSCQYELANDLRALLQGANHA